MSSRPIPRPAALVAATPRSTPESLAKQSVNLAGAMGSSTGFEYTVLINGRNTIQIVTEKAGLRVGDCVSVERGSFNNIRLAADDRCDAAANAAVPRAAASAADACTTATQQVLNAQTDAEFERAERRMRLLCD